MLKQFLLTVVSVILVSALLSSTAMAQLPKKINHVVSLDSAKKYIKNLEKDAVQMKVKGGMFFREDIDKLLSQKGVMGIRYYYAKTDEGTPTIVLVGVDSSERDMTKSMLLEKSNPCPPFCDSQSILSK